MIQNLIMIVLALVALTFLVALCTQTGSKLGKHSRITDPTLSPFQTWFERLFLESPRVIAANIAEGLHPDGALGKRADAAITDRNRLVKIGSDSSHIALCGAADMPLGVCPDEPEAAEDPVAVLALGARKGTVPMVASEAIAADVDVYTAANGKIQDEPAAAGTFWLVGKTVGAAGADGDDVEVIPCKPVKLVVVTAIGNANGAIAGLTSSATTTQAEFNALRDATETLADDVRKLTTALGSPCLVKVLAS